MYARKSIPKKSKAEPDLQDIIDGYAQSPPHLQQIISDLMRDALAKQPPEPAA